MKYGPNARTIRKTLMHRRCNSLWGQRSYICVKVPFDVFPERPVPLLSPGKPMLIQGMWSRIEDGRLIVTDVSRLTSGGDPRYSYTNDQHRAAIQFLEEKRDTYGISYDWWEGWEVIHAGVEEESDVVERRLCDPAYVANHRLRHNFLRNYVRGYARQAVIGTDRGPVFKALWDVALSARAAYGDIADDHVLVTWGVKWYRPRTKLEFCSALANLFKIAGERGFKLKLVR